MSYFRGFHDNLFDMTGFGDKNKTLYPHLFCRTIWVLQNKALRVLCGVGFKDSVQKRYINRKILPLAGLITFYRSLFIHKYSQIFYQICFKSMLELGSDIHTHIARQSNIIRRPLAITRRPQFSIRHLGPHAWNYLPTILRNMDNFPEFWRELKPFCH